MPREMFYDEDAINLYVRTLTPQGTNVNFAVAHALFRRSLAESEGHLITADDVQRAWESLRATAVPSVATGCCY